MLYSLEYVWIGGNQELRSKTRVLKKLDFKNIPSWNFDGSSTGQASGKESEIILKPVKIFTIGNPSPSFLFNCIIYFSH